MINVINNIVYSLKQSLRAYLRHGILFLCFLLFWRRFFNWWWRSGAGGNYWTDFLSGTRGRRHCTCFSFRSRSLLGSLLLVWLFVLLTPIYYDRCILKIYYYGIYTCRFFAGGAGGGVAIGSSFFCDARDGAFSVTLAAAACFSAFFAAATDANRANSASAKSWAAFI